MRQIILAINALLKFKAYTLINVLGLACSLACVLTVARYIHQENTVNQCFPEYKRICLIKTSTSSGENFLGGYRSGLEKDPAVEQFTVIYQISDMPVLFGEQEIAANAFSVDSTFFKIFPYRVIAGSGRIVRSRDVVITRSFWKKKLGGKNAIGAGTPIFTPSIPASMVSRNSLTAFALSVKRQAPLANSEVLAKAMASAKVFTLTMLRTGAKISSCQMSIS